MRKRTNAFPELLNVRGPHNEGLRAAIMVLHTVVAIDKDNLQVHLYHLNITSYHHVYITFL